TRSSRPCGAHGHTQLPRSSVANNSSTRTPLLVPELPLASGMEQRVALCFEHPAYQGRVAKGGAPDYLGGSNVNLPPSQLLQERNRGAIDSHPDASPPDGRLAHRTRFRGRVEY